jgi:hypothetical protein
MHLPHEFFPSRSFNDAVSVTAIERRIVLRLMNHNLERVRKETVGPIQMLSLEGPRKTRGNHQLEESASGRDPNPKPPLVF